MYKQIDFEEYELDQIYKIEVIDWPNKGDHSSIIGSLTKLNSFRENKAVVFKILLIANNPRYQLGEEYGMDIEYRKQSKHFTTKVTKL